jgi:hypothetical protein
MAPIGEEKQMLWTLFVVLVVLWLLGFSFHVGGALIHILIVIAVVVLIFNLIGGRRSSL